jgi:phospholipase/carboxylesterase
MSDENILVVNSGDDSNATDAAVIWLHGLGADGNDFVPIVAELKLPATLNVRFIFPHAPVRPITINQGYRMRGWFDVTSFDIAGCDDESGIIESANELMKLCDQQVAAGIAAERIVVAGFSQGGAVALYAGLRYPRTLGGIMALSTFLPLQLRLQQEAAEANRNTPIFMAHGLHDDIIALQFAIQSRMLLQQLGYRLQWHDYAMGHSVCMEEVQDISAWLDSILTPQ